MGVHHDGTPFADASKPRWAKGNRPDGDKRPKKPVTLRLSPDDLAIVDAAAEKVGLNRTAWMTRTFLKAAEEEGVEVSQPEELEKEFDRFDPEYLRQQLG